MTSRPQYRAIHTKRAAVERWCDANGVSRDIIREVRNAYESSICYVVHWQD